MKNLLPYLLLLVFVACKKKDSAKCWKCEIIIIQTDKATNTVNAATHTEAKFDTCGLTQNQITDYVKWIYNKKDSVNAQGTPTYYERMLGCSY